MSRSGLPADYGTFLGEIKSRIRSAQYEALRKVNKELVALYWDIGRGYRSGLFDLFLGARPTRYLDLW